MNAAAQTVARATRCAGQLHAGLDALHKQKKTMIGVRTRKIPQLGVGRTDSSLSSISTIYVSSGDGGRVNVHERVDTSVLPMSNIHELKNTAVHNAVQGPQSEAYTGPRSRHE